MSCQEKSGFLFAHDCDSPAVAACSRCGKNVCESHSRQGDKGPVCISCAKQDPAGVTKRNNDPFWYAAGAVGAYAVYDAGDADAFEETGKPGGEPGFEGNPDAS